MVRIEQFNKGSLGKIGGETERTSKHHRNEDIDSERTPLNLYFKRSEGGLTAQWKRTMQELNATFCEKKKSVAFEGMIITSDTAFFERLGWKKGEETPYAVMEFFNRCYEFALREIGYKGTDKNILSAVIHVDEKTPHLQLYYIPVVDTAKKKVYEKGADGKVLRNEKCSPKILVFMMLIYKYSNFEELTPEILCSFIDKVIVHEKTQVNGHYRQIVEIIYNFVGAIVPTFFDDDEDY